MSEIVIVLLLILISFFSGLESGKITGRGEVFKGEYVCAYDIGKVVRCIESTKKEGE